MSEWKSLQLGEHAEVLSGFPFPSEGFSQEEGVPLIRIRDLLACELETYFIGPYPDEFVIDDGDILIGMDGDFNIVRWTKGKALLNQRVCKIFASTAELDDGYLFWLLEPELQDIHQKTPQTTVRHLSVRDLAQLRLEVPPVNEQRLIAHILDTLDTQIQKTEALIAKLEKVKEGLLHDLLTRGIDENGQLRPSPEQAPELYKDSPLGLIPKEWDIAILESVSNMVTSGSRDWARFYADSGALFVRIGNLTREHINFRYNSTIYVRPPQNADGQRTKLEPGDILISITADLGIIGVIPEGMGEAYINQHIALVRPNLAAINPRFVGHYLAGQAAQTYIRKLNDSGAKAGLNLPTIRNLLTVRPHRDEQDLISMQLDEIDRRILSAITEAKELRKLKSGLMGDLLTGRVRVTPLLEQAQATTPA